jgi:hypothetical protein
MLYMSTRGSECSSQSLGAPQDEPERRYRTLLFVGCTRARERLTVLNLTC